MMHLCHRQQQATKSIASACERLMGIMVLDIADGARFQ